MFQNCLRADPEFYVVYLLRDPRDVIVSRHAKDDSRYYVNVRVWRELDTIARRVDGHERFLTLKYEDFVSDPDRVQDAICRRFTWLERRHDFLAVPSTRRCFSEVRAGHARRAPDCPNQRRSLAA